MKKLLIMSIIMILSLTLGVSASEDLSATPSSISLTSNPGIDITDTFNVTNSANISITGTMTGSVTDGTNTLPITTVTGVSFPNGTITTVPFTLTQNDDEQTPGLYSGSINITYDSNGTEILTVPLTVTINSKPAINVKTYTSTNPLKLKQAPGGSDTETFTIENTGNTDSVSGLDITLETNNFVDSSGNQITFSDNGGSSITVTKSTDRTIQLTAAIPAEMEPGEYSGIATISNGVTSTSFLVQVLVEGFLVINDIDLDEDEAKPGEDVEFTVEVENEADDNDYDLEVELEVWLSESDTYDENDIAEDEDDDEIEDDSKFDLDESEDYDDVSDDDVTFIFTMPKDAKDGDEFYVHAKATGEDKDNNEYVATYVSDAIEIKQEKYELEIVTFELTPDSISCAKSFNIEFEVKNVGSKKIDDARLEITSSELNVNVLQSLPDLDEDYDDDDNDYRKTFTVTVPENLATGTYFIGYEIEYDDGDESLSGSRSLTVNKCSIPTDTSSDRDDSDDDDKSDSDSKDEEDDTITVDYGQTPQQKPVVTTPPVNVAKPVVTTDDTSDEKEKAPFTESIVYIALLIAVIVILTVGVIGLFMKMLSKI